GSHPRGVLHHAAEAPPPRRTKVKPSPYLALESRFRRLGALREATSMLHWDSSTVMPEGAAGARAEQLATLKVVCHEQLTDPALPELPAAAAEEDGSDPCQAPNLREMRRQWLHATALPAELVEALSKACSACEMVWRKARPEADFAAILPSLRELVALVRGAAAEKAAGLGKSPYDALLDEYEPDGSAAAIDALFEPLARSLPELIEGALARQRGVPSPR